MGSNKQPKRAISKHENEVQKFYNGKSVLITGAAGFLGKVSNYVFLKLCVILTNIN